MNLHIAGTLQSEFKQRAEATHRQRLLHMQKHERERRERREEIKDEAAEFADMLASYVTSIEIVEFKKELNTYDTATVAALQQNERAMELVRERLDVLLSRAHVLPDGRRVFKTEDGLSVFDENGNELDASTIDPAMISEDRPRWEAYKPDWERLKVLSDRHSTILGYQTELDETRELLDSGKITREVFEMRRVHLKDSMPEEVRKQIPNMEKENELTEDKTADATDKLDIPSDMVPTALTPNM